MSRLADKLRHGLRQRLYTAASLLAFEGEQLRFQEFAGELDGAPLGPSHVFDLASLTKSLVLVPGLILLQEKKKVRPGQALGEIVTASDLNPELAAQPLANFLAHCSGLPDWLPLYDGLEFSGSGTDRRPDPSWRGEIFRQVRRLAPAFAPQSRAVYSDLGFILLTEAVETAAGCRLDEFYEKEIKPRFSGLGAVFRPISASGGGGDLSQIVPTGLCTRRGKLLRGEVNDQNAWAMGGVSGHAGLFATAGDVFLLLRGLAQSQDGLGPLPANLLAPYLKKYRHPPDSSWCLGFDTPSPEGSSSGSHFTRESTIGHLGYTGTSFWLDLYTGRGIILLTNRPQAGEHNKMAFRKFRPALHDLIMSEWDSGGGNGSAI